MQCKKCWRECSEPKFVPEFGILVTPTYCNERHGGLNQTLKDLRTQANDEKQAKPALMNVGGGLGRERRETPEQRETRLAEQRKKQDDKKAERKKLRGPKKQKGKKNNKGGGEKKGKKGKPEKDARKNAKYGVTPSPPTTAPNPPTAKE